MLMIRSDALKKSIIGGFSRLRKLATSQTI